MLRNVFGGVAILLSVGLMSVFPSQSFAGARGVVELFTSQGCSSCPPADELAAEYAKDPNLVVLTLPVTYWDYLGWKDTFAKKAFTERQYAYAALRGDRSVYTPQVVVNGAHHAVGSNDRAIKRLIVHESLPVDVNIKPAGNDLSISVSASSKKQKSMIWMVLFQQKGTVAIGRGENRNRKITYTNIVREMRPLGVWEGDAMTIKFAKPDVVNDEVNGFAVLLQTKYKNAASQILGADAWISQAGN